MKMESLDDLLLVSLTYALDFEERVADAAPQMAGSAANPDLHALFCTTERKCREYGHRIQLAFGKLGAEPVRSPNKVAQAMIEETQTIIRDTVGGPVRDAALISLANQQQLYREASYGALQSYAASLGKGEALEGLRESLDDSETGDQKLMGIAEAM